MIDMLPADYRRRGNKVTDSSDLVQVVKFVQTLMSNSEVAPTQDWPLIPPNALGLQEGRPPVVTFNP